MLVILDAEGAASDEEKAANEVDEELLKYDIVFETLKLKRIVHTWLSPNTDSGHLIPRWGGAFRSGPNKVDIVSFFLDFDGREQICLGSTYQMGKMYIYQKVIKHTNIFHWKTLQNVPKLEFLV
jgi:hypothetical protein